MSICDKKFEVWPTDLLLKQSRDSPENEQSISQLRNTLHRNVRASIVHPANGRPRCFSPRQKKEELSPWALNGSPIGLSWKHFSSTCSLVGGFHRRQAPIQIIGGFLPLVPCTPDQEQELGLFLLHVHTRLYLASCSHTSLGAHWDHPYTRAFDPATLFAQITL